MAQTMTASLQIPHMCLSEEVDVTKLLKARLAKVVEAQILDYP
jgi:hypothetical protein